MADKSDRFLQNVFAKTRGQLHRQLQIPKTEKVPISFLENIVQTKVGEVAHNPTGSGVSHIKVTLLLKRRAVGLLNADKARR